MFKNDRYITRGIRENINPLHYLMLYNLIDTMVVEEKDYLQIFKITIKFNKRKFIEVEHTQEQPPYRAVHEIFTPIPINNMKIYVIDNGEYTTMILAEEY